MEILLWLVPPVVVTVLAMLWVAWLGREGRGEVDREVAVRRLGEALQPTSAAPPAAPGYAVAARRATAAPASPYAPPRRRTVPARAAQDAARRPR